MFERFVATARRHADDIAIGNEDGVVTFAELQSLSERLAPWLAGTTRPPVVMVALRSGPRLSAVQLAGLAAGAIVAPVPIEQKPREARESLELLDPDALIVESASACPIVAAVEARGAARGAPIAVLDLERWADAEAGRLPRPATPDRERALPDDAALVHFTSGSTGTPKGVVLTRRNLEAYLDGQAPWLTSFAGQQVFCPVPQFHSYGNTVALEYLLHGVGVHLANRFMPAADVARIAGQGCAGVLAPPTWFRFLLRLGGLTRERLPSLQWGNLGTAPADPALLRALTECRPDVAWQLRYGLTETTGHVARLALAPGEAMDAPGLVGRPVPGIAVAPLPPLGAEPAEVRVGGATVAAGQLVGAGRWEPLVGPDGWWGTGDLGVMDAAGRLHLRGRSSTLIKRNGHRVHPAEIERVLAAQPAVTEAVVFGMPDPAAGEKILAVAESATADAKELLECCREQLSAFKVPQELRVVQRLQRTQSGKPDRPAITAAFLREDD
ncbi:MAG: class I adenylate-forming enzyme family protein [Planctomycetota bacterium]